MLSSPFFPRFMDESKSLLAHSDGCARLSPAQYLYLSYSRASRQGWGIERWGQKQRDRSRCAFFRPSKRKRKTQKQKRTKGFIRDGPCVWPRFMYRHTPPCFRAVFSFFARWAYPWSVCNRGRRVLFSLSLRLPAVCRGSSLIPNALFYLKKPRQRGRTERAGRDIRLLSVSARMLWVEP